jgi:hypothetical protein
MAKIPKILGILTVTMTLLGGGTARAQGLDLGAICFSTAPFVDVLVWFLNNSGANQVIGSGRDLAGDRSQTVSGVILDGVLNVGYTTHPQSGLMPVIAGGTIDLATGTGPGQCFAPDLASCGDFTFARIPCPEEGMQGPSLQAAPSGPAQGAE